MFSNYFEHISGIDIFPVISLLLFFTMFVFIVIRIAFMKKNYIDKMKNLPLDINKNGKNYEN